MKPYERLRKVTRHFDFLGLIHASNNNIVPQGKRQGRVPDSPVLCSRGEAEDTEMETGGGGGAVEGGREGTEEEGRGQEGEAQEEQCGGD